MKDKGLEEDNGGNRQISNTYSQQEIAKEIERIDEKNADHVDKKTILLFLYLRQVNCHSGKFPSYKL